MNPTPEDLQIFEEAFSAHCGGCVRECNCGKVFYDEENSYDWGNGELQGLKENSNATGLPYSVSCVSIEGREYVIDCDCWHKRARQIKAFIDGHHQAIADYLNKEKQRLQAIADAWPVAESLITNGLSRICERCGHVNANEEALSKLRQAH